MEHPKAARHDIRHPQDVIVVGESLIDIVTTPSGLVEHPGGSPANVAYGLGRLGVSTGLYTAIAADGRGALIEDHLRRVGVALLPESKFLTRTATATATLAPDGSADYGFDIHWDLPGAAPAYFPRILHTGSIATFLSPGAGAVKALLGSQAEAKGIFEELVSLADVVKLSDEDARWLYPAKTLEETADRILGLGVGLAVITKGADGSQFTSPAASITTPLSNPRSRTP